MTSFLQLSADDRREALDVAAGKSGRPFHLLEKDIYVVWALQVLFGTPFAQHLVFKGGTSLSKAYQVIRRFSEDVDITYDIRAIAPDLIQKAGGPIPPTRSQEHAWTKEIRPRLAELVEKRLAPLIAEASELQSIVVRVTNNDDTLFINYDPLRQAGSSYVSPVVRLEFGARATGEPAETRFVACDAAQHLPDLAFPAAATRAMHPQRTFWEKATAIHVFCEQDGGEDRFARHWYDLACLDKAGYADEAIHNGELAREVARHKGMFFREKNDKSEVVDYMAAVTGALQLVPDGKALEELAEDYAKMAAGGLFLDEAEPFETLIAHCASIQDRANETAKL